MVNEDIVIKILPKDIYSIENQKVIDNAVDRIELQQKVPQLVNDTENVYNESITEGFLQEGIIADYAFAAYEASTNQPPNQLYVAIAYIGVQPTYVTKTYNIKKTRKNSIIVRLFTGTDENGNSNIKYSIRGNVEKGNILANSTITTPKYLPIGDDYDPNLIVNSNSISKTQTNITNNTSYNFNNLEDLLKVTYTYNNPYNNNYTYSISKSVKLPDKINVFNVKAIETSTSYTLTFSILSGLSIQKLEGLNGYKKAYGAETVDFPLTGTYEVYTPTQVNVSFNGDTITLDLENDNIVIGDGENIISVGGNELMQSTNTAPYTDILLEKHTSGGLPIFYIKNEVNVQSGSRIDINGQILLVEGVADNKLVFYDENFGSNLADGTNLVGKILQASGNQVQKTYQTIIDNWKDGKETATIKCGIADYYNLKDNLIISKGDFIKLSEVAFARYLGDTGEIYFAKCAEPLAVDTRLSYTWNDNGVIKTEEVTVFSPKDENGYIQVYSQTYKKFGYLVGQNNTINVVAGLPMTFHLGNTCVPYVRVGGGDIKPMSRHIDGTAKQFNVVGKKIIYDGGIWQEITLLEKT